MKKNKRVRKSTDAELRGYYDQSSSFGEGDRLRSAALSLPKPRRLVALRLEETTLEEIKILAAAKGLNFSTLMRLWITERLRREVRPVKKD